MTANSEFENLYRIHLASVIDYGAAKLDRTGVGTYSEFGKTITADISGGKIPLLTGRKIYSKSFMVETLWMISGSTDIEYLKKYSVGIWDEWVIPGTAKWVETNENISDKDLFTYARTYKPNKLHSSKEQESFNLVYNAWIKTPEFKTDINYEGFSKYLCNILDIDKNTLPKIKLVSGSIGEGAYGSQWRFYKDTRIVTQREYEDPDLPYSAGYQPVSKFTNGDNYLVVTRYIDQLQNAIETIKKNPDSRRIIVSAWNPAYADQLPLPPCHSLFQFVTRKCTMDELSQSINDYYKNSGIDVTFKDNDDGLSKYETMFNYATKVGIPNRMLSCLVYCRSQDLPLGTAFNIPQYAFLTHLIASVTNTLPDKVVWVGGDVHVYTNQVGAMQTYLETDVLDDVQPKLVIKNKKTNINDYVYEDFEIEDYKSNPAINIPIAI